MTGNKWEQERARARERRASLLSSLACERVHGLGINSNGYPSASLEGITGAGGFRCALAVVEFMGYECAPAMPEHRANGTGLDTAPTVRVTLPSGATLRGAEFAGKYGPASLMMKRRPQRDHDTPEGAEVPSAWDSVGMEFGLDHLSPTQRESLRIVARWCIEQTENPTAHRAALVVAFERTAERAAQSVREAEEALEKARQESQRAADDAERVRLGAPIFGAFNASANLVRCFVSESDARDFAAGLHVSRYETEEGKRASAAQVLPSAPGIEFDASGAVRVLS